MGPEELYGYGALWVHALVGVIEGAHEGVATPCRSWCTRDVVEHLIAGNDRTAALVRQQPEQRGAPVAGDDAGLQERYRRSAADVMVAFTECMALSQRIEADGGTYDGEAWYRLAAAEQWVHGRDLATALNTAGAEAPLPADVAGLEHVVIEAAVGAAVEGTSDLVDGRPVTCRGVARPGRTS